jgi:hypothetical protein
LVGIVIKDMIMENIRLINLTEEDVKLEDIVRIEDHDDHYYYLFTLTDNIFGTIGFISHKGECLGVYDNRDIVVIYYTPKIYFDYYYS